MERVGMAESNKNKMNWYEKGEKGQGEALIGITEGG